MEELFKYATMLSLLILFILVIFTVLFIIYAIIQVIKENVINTEKKLCNHKYTLILGNFSSFAILECLKCNKIKIIKNDK